MKIDKTILTVLLFNALQQAKENTLRAGGVNCFSWVDPRETEKEVKSLIDKITLTAKG